MMEPPKKLYLLTHDELGQEIDDLAEVFWSWDRQSSTDAEYILVDSRLECLYPDRCLMPGNHFASECHTVEDYESYLADLENDNPQGGVDDGKK